MKIFQPIVNCGLCAGDLPNYFENNYGSFVGFRTKKECDAWINDHIFDFTSDEQAGGVYPQEYDVENPSIIDEFGDVIDIISDEEEKTNFASDLTKEQCLESIIKTLDTPIMRRKLSKDLRDCLDKYLSF